MVKKKYTVFILGVGYGCYAKDFCKNFVGYTWATSVNKAVSNVRYRMRQEGKYIPNDLGDIYERGYVHFELVAEECIL